MSVEETRFARLDGRLDTDWYRIALEAGQLYHVEMHQTRKPGYSGCVSKVVEILWRRPPSGLICA
jgi:hypothetical protein